MLTRMPRGAFKIIMQIDNAVIHLCPRGKVGAPAGAVPNLTNTLVAPGAVWGDRLNVLDFRVGKNLRLGRTRGLVALDLYNSLNSNSAITYNQVFNPAITTGSSAWLAPTSVLTARIAKITLQFDF